MTDTEKLIAQYGDPAFAPPATETVHAGPVSLVVTSDGDIRYISCGEREMIRRVYAAVRANDWWTVPATVTVRERTVSADSFRIVSEAYYAAPERGIGFRATIILTGDADGRVTFDFDGEALTDFERKRIGICVLHPADAKGAAVTIAHTDSSEETGFLPDTISPHQPFFDIAAIRHTVTEGLEAEVAFSGDVFEMEDQRNWLDASFKTYSTPLALPSPVLVEARGKVKQTVTVRPLPPAPLSLRSGEKAGAPDTESPNVSLASATTPSLTPPFSPEREERGRGGHGTSIGIVWSDEFATRAFAPALPKNSHIWLDLDASEREWRSKLQRADRVAARLGVTLYVFYQNIGRYRGRYTPTGLHLRQSSAPTRYFAAADDWARLNQYFGTTKFDIANGTYTQVGVGFRSNFTDLNRIQPKTFADTPLFFAGSPQVHATDSLSIAETPSMIAEAVRTARAFAGGRPVHVGPLTFTGPYAASDPRETARFGQEWYEQILTHAIEAGADSVTLGKKALPVLQKWYAKEGSR